MTASTPITHYLTDEAATLALGGSLAPGLTAPLVIYLDGDLGAGKTTFTRGLLRGLGHQGAVKSPTYTLVESYPLERFTLHHFDLYRFGSPEEWDDAGLDELFDNRSICLIEWPQQAEGFVPPADLTAALKRSGDGRSLTLTAHTDIGRKSLEVWSNQLPAAAF
ncbi:phosphotransferase [Neisseria arctica]|uniref:tRNA threonylcarbamoyladenosine biosynthesis protein TsaE n=1 Tax=Neisseria arctica TaxID=1470200 RepID=A0A0J0YQY9_9NEIS|nr:tRNA (adenosine(37)-N6)-threonylcarbamoyltransferase complex ATPase subunit type 1 TsaE [Neisseria arctica]KLT72556.1 phosphotransferase [Neisseria arctica]UOO87610.1 tRNA (adenosine(37)-N6)-threonylcarbamoyltransferase complex ATPase subunit type 1 TsaE [Neisseria arctica]